MSKPYIKIKTGRDEEFNATNVIVEPEVYPNGQIYYVVVGIDENKRLKKNIDHSVDLNVALDKMREFLIPIILLQKQEKTTEWEKENGD